MSLLPTLSCFCKQPTMNSPYSPLTVPAVFSGFISQSPAQKIKLWWAWKTTWGRISIVTSRMLGNSMNVHIYCNKKIFCADHSFNEIRVYQTHSTFILSQYLTNLIHKICFTISFISCLYMFRAYVLIIRRSKLHYTASWWWAHMLETCRGMK